MRKLLLLIPLLLFALPSRAQTVQCLTPSGAWGPCPLNASVQLFTTIAATGTATATAQKVYNFSMSGDLIVTYAGITGSPASCTLQMKSGDSLGNLINNGGAVSTSPANGTTSTSFTPATSQQTADQVSVVYSCGTYPTAGTISLEFVPSTTSMPLDSSGNLKVNITAQGLGKVLVTPDSVALPANQSVNESQINGVTPLMNNGVSGTGSQRVNIASDNTAIANWGHGATGSAVPANATAEGLKDTAGNLQDALADTNGRQFFKSYPDTTTTSYHASSSFAGSSTTDNAVMPGNATNTVLLNKVTVTCTQTTAGTVTLTLIKRSAADTSGTSATMTKVPDDANYAAAVSAPLTYTGTGPSVGAAVGNLDVAQFGCNASATAGPNDIYIFKPLKPIILRGTAQQVAVNMGNAAITGGTLSVTFDWSETTTP